ncbi:MAG: glyoxalase [Chloroflexi bacterium]|nr:glyoxalase [Chloroflexota bacterium]
MEKSSMRVRFVAGFAPIVPDLAVARRLYVDVLGLPLEGDDYPMTHALDGVKHFGLWPLSEAARACFGIETWPSDVPAPQGSLEFEVDDVDTAAAELEARGYRLLVSAHVEPWGQTVARLLGPEGLLIGLTVTPWLREDTSQAPTSS